MGPPLLGRLACCKTGTIYGDFNLALNTRTIYFFIGQICHGTPSCAGIGPGSPEYLLYLPRTLTNRIEDESFEGSPHTPC
jgi:hypothetical protein